MSEPVDDLSLRRPVVADHARVLAAVAEWWPGGRGHELRGLLPRLFFQHFASTSWVLEDGACALRGFLIGFRSADDPAVAYIHFVGVDPSLRRSGVASWLYRTFFDEMAAVGVSRVDAITGPPNTVSQAYHRAMGFTVSDVIPDYDGPGEDRVSMSRVL